jgi:hypothetical protein
MQPPLNQTNFQLLRSIRLWLSLFTLGLILSGITAFPLQHELALLLSLFANTTFAPGLVYWLQTVHDALVNTNARYPFLAYGTDWLAFAHLVLAVAFIGPLRDPIRNKWVIHFGLIACAAVPLLAFIAGPIRGIPFYWRLIDSSFGIFGAIPLLIALHRECTGTSVTHWTGDIRYKSLAELRA